MCWGHPARTPPRAVPLWVPPDRRHQHKNLALGPWPNPALGPIRERGNVITTALTTTIIKRRGPKGTRYRRMNGTAQIKELQRENCVPPSMCPACADSNFKLCWGAWSAYGLWPRAWPEARSARRPLRAPKELSAAVGAAGGYAKRRLRAPPRVPCVQRTATLTTAGGLGYAELHGPRPACAQTRFCSMNQIASPRARRFSSLDKTAPRRITQLAPCKPDAMVGSHVLYKLKTNA
jgi:hypothetical protein